ncbi:MAG TPA: DUF6350 family protein, partial [Candidatus Eisenbacteria bacterium]|nr:DUF6350 family protein [Candidatus Eisenbacteria bacterium]
MTAPTSAPARRPSVPDDARRPLTVSAVVAGLVASGGLLMVCMAAGLAGWFASDGGSHGDTVDAFRVGADAWLLAHGARLELTSATVSVVPLGLTLLCGYVCYRLGRWAAASSVVEDARAVLTGATVLAGVYAAVTVLTGVLASLESAQPHLGLAFAGGFVVSFLCGGMGVLSGSTAWPG